MPDIVAEVQSPDRTLRMMADRATIYLANGVRVVVLIYPATRTVEVVTPDDTTLLTENDTLTLDLLPGFAVPVKSLFSGI
jgi:Uma2 family endonuclease